MYFPVAHELLLQTSNSVSLLTARIRQKLFLPSSLPFTHHLSLPFLDYSLGATRSSRNRVAQHAEHVQQMKGMVLTFSGLWLRYQQENAATKDAPQGPSRRSATQGQDRATSIVLSTSYPILHPIRSLSSPTSPSLSSYTNHKATSPRAEGFTPKAEGPKAGGHNPQSRRPQYPIREATISKAGGHNPLGKRSQFQRQEVTSPGGERRGEVGRRLVRAATGHTVFSTSKLGLHAPS